MKQVAVQYETFQKYQGYIRKWNFLLMHVDTMVHSSKYMQSYTVTKKIICCIKFQTATFHVDLIWLSYYEEHENNHL